jgi:hypothetical protein
MDNTTDKGSSVAATTSNTKRQSSRLQWQHINGTKKLEISRFVLETSSRLSDASTELSNIVNSLDDELTVLRECRNQQQRLESIQRIRSKIQTINHPIVSLIHFASGSLHEAGSTLAPPRASDVSQRDVLKNERLQLRNDFVHNSAFDLREGIDEKKVAVVSANDKSGADYASAEPFQSKSGEKRKNAMRAVESGSETVAAFDANVANTAPAVSTNNTSKSTESTSHPQKKRKLSPTVVSEKGLKPGAHEVKWREEEDAIVIRYIAQSARPNFAGWSDLAPQLPGKSGKQIRDRWINYLNPAINHLFQSKSCEKRKNATRAVESGSE